MEGQWKEYFVFSRRERVAILLLVMIILALIILPSFIPEENFPVEELSWVKLDSVETGTNNTWQGRRSVAENNSTGYQSNTNFPNYSRAKNFSNKDNDGKRAYYREEEHQVPAPVLFYFDPNTATAEEWKKLGIRERQVLTIQRYISKGGKFRKAEDLSKLYGLKEQDVQRLMPYVRIKAVEHSLYKDNQQPKHMQTLEINTASRTEWEKLPGIGATLALRIINFREKLGGFYSVLQVAETFGLPDSTYRKIMGQLICDSTACKKIPINQASEEQLRNHPYLRGNTAVALVNYRKEHGNFESLEDLKKVKVIDDVLYKRIRPYLKTENGIGKTEEIQNSKN